MEARPGEPDTSHGGICIGSSSVPTEADIRPWRHTPEEASARGGTRPWRHPPMEAYALEACDVVPYAHGGTCGAWSLIGVTHKGSGLKRRAALEASIADPRCDTLR